MAGVEAGQRIRPGARAVPPATGGRIRRAGLAGRGFGLAFDPGEGEGALVGLERLVVDERQDCAFQPRADPNPALVGDHRHPAEAAELAESDAAPEVRAEELGSLIWGVVLFAALAFVGLKWPKGLAYPLGVFFLWVAVSWTIKGALLWWRRGHPRAETVKTPESAHEDAA